MHSNQLIIISALLVLAVVTIQGASIAKHHLGHHGHGANCNNQTQCSTVLSTLRQFFPQSVLTLAFQQVCSQVGSTQAVSTLQTLLGVPVTGTFDQATFQAILNNSNHVALAQQLLTSTSTGVVGK